jgi:ribosomal L7/L12-like protein
LALAQLRFGYAVRGAGIQPRYETAGVGQSTLDFGFTSGGRDFLVEMMRLEETDAVRAATKAEEFTDGAVMVSRNLSTNAEDARQSEEGETLKAVERICQKFESGGKPHKFPPLGQATHVLLVDIRTFLNGGDVWDRVHVGLGGECVPSEVYRRYYKGNLISGVFSPKTKLRGAAEARERLHFIGFVNEKSYEASAIGPAIQFIANPHLFKTEEEARAALAGWPLGEPDILNARTAPAHLLKLADAMSNLTVSEAAELAKLLEAKWNVPTSNASRN